MSVAYSIRILQAIFLKTSIKLNTFESKMFECISRRSSANIRRPTRQQYSSNLPKLLSSSPKSNKTHVDRSKLSRNSQGLPETKNPFTCCNQQGKSIQSVKTHKGRILKSNSNNGTPRSPFFTLRQKSMQESQSDTPIALQDIELKFQTDERLYQQFKEKIDKALLTVTTGSNFTKHRRQNSSLKSIKDEKIIDSNDIPTGQNQAKEGSLIEAITSSMLARDFEQSQYLLKRMKAEDKNQMNSKGHTLAQLSTLLAIHDNHVNKSSFAFFKKVIKDPEVNIFALSKRYIKILHEGVIYVKDIPVVTNLFKESYHRRIDQIRQSLNKLSDYFEQIPDHHFQLFVKVSSFIPLVEKLAPDDTIKVYKKGKQLRIDYTLIGYSFLQAKRRNMSCIIEGTGAGLTMVSVNHDQRTYMDLLQGLSREELVLIIEDILCTEHKRTSPKVVSSRLEPQTNIFNQSVREVIAGYMSVKHTLSVSYQRKTQMIVPGSRKTAELDFLKDLNSYQQHLGVGDINEANKLSQKELKLGLWMPRKFPIKYDSILKIMSFFALNHEAGQVIHQFLSQERIKASMKHFPLKIQIPINFSIYLDIQMTAYSSDPDTNFFTAHHGYQKRPRQEFQKTLTRRDKRLAMVKVFT